MEAMPKGGTLTIKTQTTSNDVFQISFKDTGIGMNKETLNKLFEPFYTTKDDKGTGLGLSVSKQIIEGHRGNTSVKSTLNKGSVFIITLPI